MSTSTFIVGPVKKINQAINKIANSSDHRIRIGHFSAVVGEDGEPLISVVFLSPKDASYDDRITGGKLLVCGLDKAEEKIEDYLKKTPNASIAANILLQKWQAIPIIKADQEKEKTVKAAQDLQVNSLTSEVISVTLFLHS